MEKEKLIQETLVLAKYLQDQSLKNGVKSSFSERLKPLLAHPDAKVFLIHLMDVAFRSENTGRMAAFVRRLFQSSTNYRVLFSGTENLLVRLFTSVGYLFPSISIPLMHSRIRAVSENVVFESGGLAFQQHITNRHSKNLAMNVNLIGEALLGEQEAAERMVKYRALLRTDSVNYISIKISTIYSQIESIAYKQTLDILVDRLSNLYQELVNIHSETKEWKFVNLDMEEYRDLSLTVDAFMLTLSKPEFKKVRAGIVLQAYLPDSYAYLKILQQWAENRINEGGAPIKIRVVKGANMEMEKTEASTQGWELVTFHSKTETDANYKKMLNALLNATSCKSVHVGVASHNVFDLAYALTLVKAEALYQYVDFEMLEGMASTLVSAMQEQGATILLYTPLVEKANYMSAIAYLVRRLDEGTQEGNFLREGFNLSTNSPKWEVLEQQFLQSVNLEVHDKPHRQQNRLETTPIDNNQGFTNTPDTDWALAQNRIWLDSIIEKWQTATTILGESYVPVVSELSAKNRQYIKQQNWQGELPWSYELANESDYQQVISEAKHSPWLKYSHTERIAIIRKAAVELQKSRGDLIGVGVAEVGKLVKELDSEISEAVDFANYYAYSMEDLLSHSGVDVSSGGINLVLSPWNFPIAIPAGGVLASLVSGNTVILKPSTNAAACAYVMCQCLWRAGVPKSALAFLPAEEKTLDTFLTASVFDAVILTGGTDTAKFLLNRNPRLPLYAETGGKNATIVTALSDREQAVKHIIHSAFGNTGQKCSATSLLILEEEVFQDAYFKALLKDALASKKVGSPWDVVTQIGPLANMPNKRLMQSIEQTKSTEWLVSPTVQSFYMSPGVKWGVTTQDMEYREELFGPILSVMKANNLDEAIDLVNGVAYGLTSGLESLDEAEITKWKNNVKAGNLYVNRPTTGAIVQRQPFGGMKASCFGFGMKAGGANYLFQFLNVSIKIDKTQLLDYAKKDFSYWYETHFSKEIDEANIRGQYNINRYLKPKKVVLTVDQDVLLEEAQLVKLACDALQIPLELVYVKTPYWLHEWNGIGARLDSWEALESYFTHDTVIRAINKTSLSDNLLCKAHMKAVHLYGKRPLPWGRFELLNYLTEQNISHSYHRYGNLMGK